MQIGDYLICKDDYYLDNVSKKSGIKFIKPFFIKNEKYKIDNIICVDVNISSYTSGTTNNCSPDIHITYNIKYDYFDSEFIPKWFYDIKTIRKEKINKIDKLCK